MYPKVISTEGIYSYCLMNGRNDAFIWVCVGGPYAMSPGSWLRLSIGDRMSMDHENLAGWSPRLLCKQR